MTRSEWAIALPPEVEDWIESEVDALLELYRHQGTPLRGGLPIADAMRRAFRKGESHDQG